MIVNKKIYIEKIITITWQKFFYQNLKKKKKKTGHLLSLCLMKIFIEINL